MSALKTAHMLTRYNTWANQVFYDSVFALQQGEAEKPRATLFKNIVHTLNHNYVIDSIFRAHVEGREHGYNARNTVDHPPLAELWGAQQEFDAWFILWSDSLSAESLDETLNFTFVGGGLGAMTYSEIILHLIIHTSYHRGFAADMFFQVPARPPTTDLPVYLRGMPP